MTEFVIYEDTVADSSINNGFLPEDDIKSVLSLALSKGGNFSEVYSEAKNSLYISMSENKIKSLNFTISKGAGVRVLDDRELGYAYTDNLSLKELKDIAPIAGEIASKKSKKKVKELATPEVGNNISWKIPLESISEKEKTALLWEANETARNYSRYVTEVSITYSEENKKVQIANSYGIFVTDKQPLSRFSIFVTAVKGDVRQTGFHSFSDRGGWELYTLDRVKNTAAEAARQAVSMLDAKEAPSGEMVVILPNGWGGVLFHEAIGHAFEGDFVRKKTSVYSDMLGKLIASPLVSVVDDGTLFNKRGTTNVDDEGIPTQRTVLIDGGVCAGFLYDLHNASLMNTKSTGNGRRQSYRFSPQPRMTNTIMLKGTNEKEELIKETPKGLLVKQLSGGSVDITTGHFVFNVTEAYLIEKGKITCPVRGASLIGKGSEILNKIDMVAGNVDTGAGTCGKGGQYVPVSVGQPDLRISEMTVGGARV